MFLNSSVFGLMREVKELFLKVKEFLLNAKEIFHNARDYLLIAKEIHEKSSFTFGKKSGTFTKNSFTLTKISFDFLKNSFDFRKSSFTSAKAPFTAFPAPFKMSEKALARACAYLLYIDCSESKVRQKERKTDRREGDFGRWMVLSACRHLFSKTKCVILHSIHTFKMQIGNIDLGSRPVLLAPMEDVTDIGFRLLCRRMGAAMVYSEFVSCDALTRMVESTLRKLRTSDEERPVAIQIYGKDPGAMAEAAQIVVEQAQPDIIDINFGCPVKRVAGKGAGAGLLQNTPLMLEIAKAVVDAVNIPVTAKTRLGWDHDHIIIGTLAEQLQDTGISALTIHGRTRSQMYTGQANWQAIGEVKRNPRITIPIIGNGDICSAEQAEEAFNNYGTDAIMVGRASFGRPWIFKEIHDRLHPDQPSEAELAIKSDYPPMSSDWKLDVLKEQVRQSVERIDEYRGILHIRRHLAATPLFKGIPDFRPHRIAMLRAETTEELYRLMDETRPLIQP